MDELPNFSFKNLLNSRCVPYSVSEKSLSEEEVREAFEYLFYDRLSSKDHWHLTTKIGFPSIEGKFFFRDYTETFAFVSAVYMIAISENHYPEIVFGDGFVKITLASIKLKGIGKNDLIMLAKIENLSAIRDVPKGVSKY